MALTTINFKGEELLKQAIHNVAFAKSTAELTVTDSALIRDVLESNPEIAAEYKKLQKAANK